MNKVFKGGIVLALAFVVLLSVGAVYQYFYLKNMQKFALQEGTRTVAQMMDELGKTGVCVGCDIGWKPDKDKELPDLRQAVQLARSKGLEINLSNSNLLGVNLSGANLSGANLSGTNLGVVDLTEADLTGANLSAAFFERTKLMDANLTKANLHAAVFVSSFVSGRLYGANLTEADLTGAILYNMQLSEANLTGADLRGATIATSLAGADLTGAKFDNAFTYLFFKWSFLLMVRCIEIKEGLMNKWMSDK